MEDAESVPAAKCLDLGDSRAREAILRGQRLLERRPSGDSLLRLGLRHLRRPKRQRRANHKNRRTRGKAFLGACAAKHRTAKTSTANGDLAEWLTALPKPAAQLVRNIIAYLDEHALEPIRVSDVVEHAGVSPRLANLRFSQTRGHSIQEELVVRRLKEAKRLLSGTEWSMKRIAERCGFKSQIILAHLFSAHYGKSMRQWRSDARSRDT